MTETEPLAARIEAALDEIRPAIHRDGGDVWFVRLADGVAYVQLLGACGGCPMSHQTIKNGIEVALRRRCPEVDRVEHV